ncbi:MAG: sigma-54-dependent Fis family transcriptional regulator [Deltaproteobacteria bacterium]|nr:sigma-54-dependent Fis family transcriptional regulator [Deltaproteobacteria bacterium]
MTKATPTRRARAVLIVDDDELLRKALGDALASRGFLPLSAPTLAEGWSLFTENDVEIVALDEQLPDGRGNTFCARFLALRPTTKIVFMTAFPEFDHAVKAIRSGAFDYLSKPFELEALFIALERCEKVLDLEQIGRREVYQQDRNARSIQLVGDSSAFREVRRLVELAATSSAPVLITGETGTGKSLIAKAVHFLGHRRDHGFVLLSCAALPDSLLEAELFGWERGAFTSAVATHEGAFEQADRGTLFLDEVGELPVHLQPKLLNALEDHSVRRLGGRVLRGVDARIIAATNARIERLIDEKQFRADLYYRLAVVPIHVPPLRERPEDLPALVEKLLGGIATRDARPLVDGIHSRQATTVRARDPLTLATGEIERLTAYGWPGNVRELRNVLERAALLQGPELRPSTLLQARSATSEPPESPTLTLAEVEQRHIQASLRANAGNLTRTAESLGISLSTLKRRVQTDSLRKPKLLV